jgi:hypothetical protein
MFHDYCDFNHDTIINYISNQTKGLHGMEKINRIFLDIKNNIYYDGSTPIQKASETLVMGRGNNVDKTILLYTLLRAGGFECEIDSACVYDNSKIYISRNNKALPWFYVTVNFFGRKAVLDCSFDKSYMIAAGIFHKGNAKEYNFRDYILKDGNSLFSPVNGPVRKWMKKLSGSLKM